MHPKTIYWILGVRRRLLSKRRLLGIEVNISNDRSREELDVQLLSLFHCLPCSSSQNKVCREYWTSKARSLTVMVNSYLVLRTILYEFVRPWEV